MTHRYVAISPDRPIAFTCLGSQCPSTCCGPFQGTRELQAILNVSDLGRDLDPGADNAPNISIFAQIRLTPEDVDRLRQAGLDHMMVYRGDPSDPHYYLRLQEDGSCAALSKSKKCTIHPDRPTICRAFPFYVDLFAGLSMISACPGVGGEPQPLSALQEEVRATAKMYKFWLRTIMEGDVGDVPK